MPPGEEIVRTLHVAAAVAVPAGDEVEDELVAPSPGVVVVGDSVEEVLVVGDVEVVELASEPDVDGATSTGWGLT